MTPFAKRYLSGADAALSSLPAAQSGLPQHEPAAAASIAKSP